MRRGFLVPPNPYISRSENYTATRADSDEWVDISAAASNRTVTLPSATTAGAGFQITIAKSDSTANTVTINRAGSDTINGATSLVLSTQYQAATLFSNGSSRWNAIVYTPGTFGTGDVVGPGSSTANAIARFSGTTGKLLQNSGVTIDGSNNVTIPGLLNVGSYTVATLPTASSWSGFFAYASDANAGNGAWVRSNGTNWFDLGQNRIATTDAASGGGSSNAVLVDSTAIAHDSSGTISLFTLPANARVVKVQVPIVTPYNGTNPIVTVGISGNTSKYLGMTTAQSGLILPAGDIYESNPGHDPVGTTESLIATYVASGSTSGSARILVHYVTPS